MEKVFNRVLCIEVKCKANYDEEEMDMALRSVVEGLRDSLVGQVIDECETTITDVYDGGECCQEY